MLDDQAPVSLRCENLFPEHCNIESFTVRSNEKGRFIDIVPADDMSADERQRLFETIAGEETGSDMRYEVGVYRNTEGGKEYRTTKIVTDGVPTKVLGEMMLAGFITEKDMLSVYDNVKRNEDAKLGPNTAYRVADRVFGALAAGTPASDKSRQDWAARIQDAPAAAQNLPQR
tara:strand:- start:794 stop:1312 length:519 start_codon:yes stop_codon:yes gene_type:complete